MKPAEELNALYRQWRRLTEAEARFIRGNFWDQIDQLQSTKAHLQPRITEMSAQLDPVEHEHRFRPVVEELIRLEQHNRELIQAQRQIAQHQKEELEQSSRHLRQLHRSYAPGLARTHWQSYS